MQPRILMCPPDHYGIEYEINPWMDKKRQVDPSVARQQWAELRELLERCEARIELMPAVAGLPDLVFTANAAMIFKNAAVLARFRHPQRQGE
ncbi:MAG: amidinotransferase, partial [Planctomycetes bacterium]|nr:amidinotransferase [Planctomycetota bacterium]